jgi:hypothetical protein
MEQKLVLKVPDSKTPGFFKFLKGYSVFAEVMGSPATHKPADIDAAIEWLVSLVVEPKNPKVAREMLVTFSADELMAALKGLGEGVSVEPDPKA